MSHKIKLIGDKMQFIVKPEEPYFDPGKVNLFDFIKEIVILLMKQFMLYLNYSHWIVYSKPSKSALLRDTRFI